MTRKSYANIINQCRVMMDAMKANKTTLPAAITEQALHQFEQRINESIRLNATQEKLKADLKEQTAKLTETLEKLEADYADAKKRIKMDYPAERWKEFGIEDKR